MSPRGLLPGGLRGDNWVGSGISEPDWIRVLTWVTKLRNSLEEETKVVALGAVPRQRWDELVRLRGGEKREVE